MQRRFLSLRRYQPVPPRDWGKTLSMAALIGLTGNMKATDGAAWLHKLKRLGARAE